MVEFNKNLWAPWRMEYIEQLHEPSGGCFLCEAKDHPDRDDRDYVLVRGRDAFVMLNRFPYTGGHMLVAPYAHTGKLSELGDEVLLEIMQLTRDMEALLTRVLQAEGCNIGINLGRCGGAGLPDHLHVHVVPRWSGDTNFMSVVGDARVIPDGMRALYEKLKSGLNRD